MGDYAFKICCIGCGDVSTRGHGPALKRYRELNPGVELVACCDIDEKKAAGYQKKFGFARYYTDMSFMLENEKPDAVCLIVPVDISSGLQSVEIADCIRHRLPEY